MVALSKELEVSREDTQRFFARHYTHRSGAERCSRSSGRSGLRRRNYDECDQLEFCSRDPIGYGGRFSLYAYLAMSRDPMGTSPIGDKGVGADDLLTCEEFLAKVGPTMPDERWPDRAKDQLNKGAHIFCGNCNYSGGETWPDGKQCHICLNSGNETTLEDWTWLLVHELIHCSQFDCGRKADGPWVGDPIDPPKVDPRDPNAPPDPKECNKCKNWETNAYEVQCRHLFPGDRKKQRQCIDAGVCYSCSGRCKGLSGFDKDCKDIKKPEF